VTCTCLSFFFFSIDFSMLERDGYVRKPVWDGQREPGVFLLYMPCSVTVFPGEAATIDFCVAVRLPKGCGGAVELRPEVLPRHVKARVLPQRLSELVVTGSRRRDH
jgi:hypothetical protein